VRTDVLLDILVLAVTGYARLLVPQVFVTEHLGSVNVSLGFLAAER